MPRIKNLLLIIICFSSIFLTGKSNAQTGGNDIIIWLDNSGSIDEADWSQLEVSVDELIESILNCNPANKVAVVHYSALYGGDPLSLSRIYIESDFTSNLSTALNYQRRGGDGTHSVQMGASDYAHESLALIGLALDGVISPSVVSPQKTLSHNSNSSLAIFLMTDGYRSSVLSLGIPGSCIVSLIDPTVGSSAAFLNYTTFKTDRGAKFMVNLFPEDNQAIQACASIASLGGNYAGPVELNPDDPDGSGSTPRLFRYSYNFIIPSEEMEELILDLCNQVPPVGSSPEIGSQFIEIPNITVLSSLVGNDKFFVQYDGIKSFQCTIFNRWGNKLYSYYNPAGSWNGIADNGQVVSEGVYYYTISVVWMDDKHEEFNGFFHVKH